MDERIKRVGLFTNKQNTVVHVVAGFSGKKKGKEKHIK